MCPTHPKISSGAQRKRKRNEFNYFDGEPSRPSAPVTATPNGGNDRRATIRIDADAGLPTREAIFANAEGLAQYAAISQAAGLTPIVEPELLIEGTHSPELFAEVGCFWLRYPLVSPMCSDKTDWACGIIPICSDKTE